MRSELILAFVLVACAPREEAVAPESALALPSALPPSTAPAPPAPPPTQTFPNGLVVEELRHGSGALARKGRTLVVHYVGTLADGTRFDSSRVRNQPFEFVFGQGSVIKGWEQGIEGMREGDVRRLTIPPALGYGVRGHPPTIPPEATLIFEIELLEVR
jgi:FKBP-type peptidyl-prolyl cis-trans isomerase